MWTCQVALKSKDEKSLEALYDSNGIDLYVFRTHLLFKFRKSYMTIPGDFRVSNIIKYHLNSFYPDCGDESTFVEAYLKIYEEDDAICFCYMDSELIETRTICNKYHSKYFLSETSTVYDHHLNDVAYGYSFTVLNLDKLIRFNRRTFQMVIYDNNNTCEFIFLRSNSISKYTMKCKQNKIQDKLPLIFEKSNDESNMNINRKLEYGLSERLAESTEIFIGQYYCVFRSTFSFGYTDMILNCVN